MKKISLVFTLFLILTGLAIAQTENDTTTIMSKLDEDNKNHASGILVLYYSSTGNTAVMAKEIAKRFNADLINIKSATYDEATFGSIKASKDAWTEKRFCHIKPEIVDLSKYRLIFLGSPIWWYRPAVPLWTFVERNNFLL